MPQLLCLIILQLSLSSSFPFRLRFRRGRRCCRFVFRRGGFRFSRVQHGADQSFFGCRSRADLYLHDWAVAAAARMPNLSYVPVLSEPAADDAWDGRTGLVHRAVLADFADLSGFQVYACGAPVMIDAARQDFVAAGLPEEEFFSDAFTFAAQ